jgi:exosortase
VFLSLIWLQLFWSLVPTWRFGEYYSYGWFVPPLALGLAWRRWHLMAALPISVENRRVPVWFAAAAGFLLLLLFPLRIILVADPTWRPPLLLHVVIVVGLTHGLLGLLAGRRFSLAMAPVTIFALSAVPYPWRFERELIGVFTDWVITFTHEIFLLSGKPVEAFGGQLVMGGDRVEVNEGCSGIRSFQSLVMVALFFGELLTLSALRRLTLIVVAAACAVGINTLRAYGLAVIHFERGREAADAAHDWVGHTAFVVSAAILFMAALCLLRTGLPRRRVVRRLKV